MNQVEFDEFEKALDDLILDAPLDFHGTGSSASATAEKLEFDKKVEDLKALARKLLK